MAEEVAEEGPARAIKSPEECEVAQKAVAGASGRNLPKAMENLSKAYQHSKTCKKCNETLGEFLGDIIQQLGVKLPRVKDLGDRDAEYAGQPSPLTTKDPTGAGTVGYDPKTSPEGYRLKPTVSTLALALEELRDKCRVKDHMIEMMADELQRLGQKTNWSGTDLLADVSEQPTADHIDFDRRALYNYINKEPAHGLQTESEVEGTEEYPATNPLGLTVVRQVGPDSLLIKWAPPPATSQIYAFEVFVNGMFLQRIRSPGRTKTLIHPVDLSSKLFLTLNALTYDGETASVATVGYP